MEQKKIKEPIQSEESFCETEMVKRAKAKKSEEEFLKNLYEENLKIAEEAEAYKEEYRKLDRLHDEFFGHNAEESETEIGKDMPIQSEEGFCETEKAERNKKRLHVELFGPNTKKLKENQEKKANTRTRILV